MLQRWTKQGGCCSDIKCNNIPHIRYYVFLCPLSISAGLLISTKSYGCSPCLVQVPIYLIITLYPTYPPEIYKPSPYDKFPRVLKRWRGTMAGSASRDNAGFQGTMPNGSHKLYYLFRPLPCHSGVSVYAPE